MGEVLNQGNKTHNSTDRIDKTDNNYEICGNCPLNSSNGKLRGELSCPFEGSSYLTAGKIYDGGPYIDCLYYTCRDEGAEAAVRALRKAIDEGKGIIEIEVDGENVKVVRFSTRHKPWNKIRRWVEIDDDHRVFIEDPKQPGILIGSTRVSRLIKGLFKKIKYKVLVEM